MHIPKNKNLKINCFGVSIWEYVKCDNKYFIEKYNNIPNKSEFVINKIPLEEEVPNILLKYESFKISELINTISSNIENKLLSIEENKLLKIVLIVSIIFWVILFW